ncbi:MAG: ABC transporter ATP-binding protein [Erysipelotrichales bacterium]|nr:ABC transporter ATP-binding protein [Erysipelotrichales bacterium]
MPKSTMRFFKSNLKNHLLSLFLSIFFALLFVIATILFTIITGKIIDVVKETSNIDFALLRQYLIVLIICALVALFSDWCLRYISSKMCYRIVSELRKKAIDKLLSVNISYIDSHQHGDLITSVIADIDIISDGLMQLFQKLFTGVMTIILTLAIMIYLCWPLAIVVFVLTPLSVIFSLIIAKKSKKVYRLQSEIKGKIGGFVNENLSNQKVIISYNNEKEKEEEYEVINKEFLDVNFKAELIAAFINPTTRLINAIIYATIAIVGGLFVANDWFSLSTGILVSFLLFANHYTKPFNEISNVISELQTSFASINRIQNLLDENGVVDDSDKLAFEYKNGDIKVENVDFSYDNQHLILKQINFAIKSRQKVAIVGTTGCGKTTLINLIMRFYDQDKGKIFVSNQNILNTNRDTLRDHFGMVLQDTWIFKGTIKDNIRYVKLDASDDEIIEAARKAKAHSFIMQMKNGYDTIVSDDSGLSNGQKQLICIARLFLAKPEMLILDEATSSIDTRTEILIQEGFDEVMKGKTSIIIAHRLSTIRNADLILVMDNGKIIEQGKHEELLDKKGFYFELYNAQFRQQ